jgi:hypothetical protein
MAFKAAAFLAFGRHGHGETKLAQPSRSRRHTLRHRLAQILVDLVEETSG